MTMDSPRSQPVKSAHEERVVVTADVVVVGGGLAGICAAVAAARNRAKTILVQDRPMPGGNSSSEIRMWICGARCAEYREGGLLEELKLANYYHNPTLKYTIWDHVMRNFVEDEPNLECYFNTSVTGAVCKDGLVESVEAWGLTDYTRYEFRGRIFADCSGDSVLACTGAEYSHGREDKRKYGEAWGTAQSDAKTMGNSIIMQLRRTSREIPFKAPAWAYHYTDETVPRPNLAMPGDNFWWLEYGGIFNTIKDARLINRELTKIALGYWEYIKNHPNGRGKGWALDWIGSLPGKRESRRYLGDYVLTQQDVLDNVKFDDAVAYGGWLLDDHHPDAIYNDGEPNRCQKLTPGYHIPFRCLYSRNVRNLMFAGRNISLSHLALSSVRVMATCAMFGQATGTAAALACRHGCLPRDVGASHIRELQQLLLLQDQFIPGVSRIRGQAATTGLPSDPRLVSGMEREDASGKEAHSILLRQGDSCGFTFKAPTPIGGLRLVWDSNFSDAKQMRCDEGEDRICELPASLGKKYLVEAKTDGRWQPIHRADDNFRRLDMVTIPTVNATALRLTLLEERKPGEPARLFAFEPLDP